MGNKFTGEQCTGHGQTLHIKKECGGSTVKDRTGCREKVILIIEVNGDRNARKGVKEN